MKFEHLIEINHPGNLLIPVLPIDHLWQGLRLRATAPQLFVPYLDQCVITDLSENKVTRISHYGKLTVHDTVTFTPLQQVHYFVPPQGEIPASSLTMTIEQPEIGALFVRFVYEDENSLTATADEAMYEDFRKSAYLEADIDTIRVIRELALSGRFDTPLA